MRKPPSGGFYPPLRFANYLLFNKTLLYFVEFYFGASYARKYNPVGD